MFGRGKGVAVVEDGQSDAHHGAVGAPGKQPRAANLAEHPVDRLGGWIARGVTLDRKRPLVEQRAGKEW